MSRRQPRTKPTRRKADRRPRTGSAYLTHNRTAIGEGGMSAGARPNIPTTGPGRWPVMQTIGATGLMRLGGRVFEEWLPELQGSRGRRVLREMQDNDAVIGGALYAIESMIRQVEWNVTPGGSDAESMADAQFIDQCLHDMEQSWEETLSEIVTFLPFGWCLQELLYKERTGGEESKFDDGRIGWAGWSIRGQETLDHWEYDDKDRLIGMWQLGPPDWKWHLIPMEKAILFRTTARKGNPEGRSLLRNAYRSWFFKKHLETIEGIGIERDLAGVPVAKVPVEMLMDDAPAGDQALVQQLKDVVTNLKRDEQEGIVWPLAYDDNGNELFTLELMTSGGTRAFDTNKIIERYNQQIAMVMLADWLMLGHTQTGTQSLGETKSDLFTTALGAWLKIITGVVNTKSIPRLLRLNGRQTDTPPQLLHGSVEKVDTSAMGEYLTKLSGIGIPLDISPNGPLTRFLMKAAGLPEPPADDELSLEASTIDQSPGKSGEKAKADQASAQDVKGRTTDDPDAAEGTTSDDSESDEDD